MICIGDLIRHYMTKEHLGIVLKTEWNTDVQDWKVVVSWLDGSSSWVWGADCKKVS